MREERNFLALKEKNSNEIVKNAENKTKPSNNLKGLDAQFGAMTLESERIEIGKLPENEKAELIRNLEKTVFRTTFDIIKS